MLCPELGFRIGCGKSQFAKVLVSAEKQLAGVLNVKRYHKPGSDVEEPPGCNLEEPEQHMKLCQ